MLPCMTPLRRSQYDVLAGFEYRTRPLNRFGSLAGVRLELRVAIATRIAYNTADRTSIQEA